MKFAIFTKSTLPIPCSSTFTREGSQRICLFPSLVIGGGTKGNAIALRFTAASEGGFESLSHRWLRLSKQTNIAKKA